MSKNSGVLRRKIKEKQRKVQFRQPTHWYKYGFRKSQSHKMTCQKIVQSRKRKCDPEVAEEIIHLITECPRSGRQRNEAEMEIGTVIKSDTLKKQEVMSGGILL